MNTTDTPRTTPARPAQTRSRPPAPPREAVRLQEAESATRAWERVADLGETQGASKAHLLYYAVVGKAQGGLGRRGSPLEAQGGLVPISPVLSPPYAPAAPAITGLHDLSEPDLAVAEELGLTSSSEETVPDLGLPGHGPLRTLVLGADTVDTIKAAVPGLEEAAHLGLALHSVLSSDIHISTDKGGNVYTRVKVGSRTLSAFEGKQKEHRHRKYRGEDFLEAHKAILPGFAYTGYSPSKYPRQVDCHGLPDPALDAIEDDLMRPLSEVVNPVLAFCGTPFPDLSTGQGASDHRLRRTKARHDARTRSRHAVCETQAQLLHLLNATPPHGISRLVNENVSEAIDVAAAIPDRAERLRELAAIRLVQIQPQPFYAPSKRASQGDGASARVFAVAMSVLSLKGQVRKAMMKGCIELDLANAQLAVAGWYFGIDSLLEILTDDEGRPRKAWPYVLGAAGYGHLRPGTAEYDSVKSALKQAVYAVVFGMSENGLRWLMTRSLSAEAARRFLDDPVVIDLIAGRDRELARILAAGGAEDCFGVRHAVVGETEEERAESARSVLSRLAQAVELQLLEPVVEAAVDEAEKPRPFFRLMAWQHDGFTVAIHRRKKRILARLERLVEERARELGVPTSLECEWL